MVSGKEYGPCGQISDLYLCEPLPGGIASGLKNRCFAFAMDGHGHSDFPVSFRAGSPNHIARLFGKSFWSHGQNRYNGILGHRGLGPGPVGWGGILLLGAGVISVNREDSRSQRHKVYGSGPFPLLTSRLFFNGFGGMECRFHLNLYGMTFF